MISEYSSRQISLMKDKIRQYREGKIRIDQLINDLESLLNCLEEINEDWKNSFLSAWSILEIVYAGALYENKTSLDNKDIIEIHRGLRLLDALIESILSN